jgi:hypothetical protein
LSSWGLEAEAGALETTATETARMRRVPFIAVIWKAPGPWGYERLRKAADATTRRASHQDQVDSYQRKILFSVAAIPAKPRQSAFDG